MFPDFASDEDLLDRLSARPHELVYLAGSAVTAPSRSGEAGVPRVDGVIELIKAEYRRPSELQRFEAALAAEPDNRYQAAFRFLLHTRDQDIANAVIRRAVMMARRPSQRFPELPSAPDDPELCRSLEDDVEGWHLPPAVEALGQVLARTPVEARPVVLTPNFDPLVAISVRRAGGSAYTTALHDDGSLTGVDGHGCLVVHFHGDWFRTDTLHTRTQLRQDRPKLSASLAQLISARTLVVLGYSGWDDVFTRSLIATIRGGLAPLKVAWAFYSSDEAQIVKNSGGLLEALRPGIEHGRVVLYRGIDAHVFLPQLSAQLAEMAAAAAVESPRQQFGSVAHPAAGRGTHASDAAVMSPLDRVLPLPAALFLPTGGPGDGTGEPGDGPTGERGEGPDPATGPSSTSGWPPWALALLALGASGITILAVLLIQAWRRPDDPSEAPEDAPPVPWDLFVVRE